MIIDQYFITNAIKQLASQLNILKIEKKYSVYKLSQVTGISQTHIRRILTGNIDCKYSTIVTLMAALLEKGESYNVGKGLEINKKSE